MVEQAQEAAQHGRISPFGKSVRSPSRATLEDQLDDGRISSMKEDQEPPEQQRQPMAIPEREEEPTPAQSPIPIEI